MKISVLVAQYFYRHRELKLPGIGAFFLDDAVTIPESSDKNFGEFLQYIQFKHIPINKADEALIDFIRTHTGKIRPLAESDLESFVSDGKVLLNIGKIFHIEGIGNLLKNKNGVYEFTPGEATPDKVEAVFTDKPAEKAPKKKSVFDDDYYPHEAKSNIVRNRILIGAGILVALIVIIWGGYSLYNSNMKPAASINEDSFQPPVIDSTSLQSDSTSIPVPATLPANAPRDFKYILETTKRRSTAERRYDDLKPKVQLETKDSVLYRIYLVINSTPADTSRIRDSLHNWYWGQRNRVITIEQ